MSAYIQCNKNETVNYYSSIIYCIKIKLVLYEIKGANTCFDTQEKVSVVVDEMEIFLILIANEAPSCYH